MALPHAKTSVHACRCVASVVTKVRGVGAVRSRASMGPAWCVQQRASGRVCMRAGSLHLLGNRVSVRDACVQALPMRCDTPRSRWTVRHCAWALQAASRWCDLVVGCSRWLVARGSAAMLCMLGTVATTARDEWVCSPMLVETISARGRVGWARWARWPKARQRSPSCRRRAEDSCNVRSR
jgi:hypothetical protein